MTREEFRTALLDEMRRLAVDGQAPSRNVYTARRADGAPSAAWAEKKLGQTWSQLAVEAGLRPIPLYNRKSTDPAADAEWPGGSDSVCAVIDAAVRNGTATPASWMDRFRAALHVFDEPTRIEVVSGRTISGQACVITRSYWMVR